jgi:hypothetical protein
LGIRLKEFIRYLPSGVPTGSVRTPVIAEIVPRRAALGKSAEGNADAAGQ